MPKARIKIQPKGDWTGFDRALMSALSVPDARVGLTVPNNRHPGERAKAKSISYKKIAKINEFGDPDLNIVPRPIFGPALQKSQDEIVKKVNAAFNAATTREGWQAALQEVADLMLAKVQHEIDNYGHQPPLKPLTVERKGHDQPWVETTALRTHIIPVILIDFEGNYDANVRRFRNKRGQFVRVGR